MTEHVATEISYKNGFEAGKAEMAKKGEICARLKVAYEQISAVQAELCKVSPHRNDAKLLHTMHGILDNILNVEVRLGVLEATEVIK